MSSFKDNFSKQADMYVKYRPLYPTELYAFLSSLTSDHELAWDCGTGNGQAATGLAEFYKKVIATDPSEQQIKNCLPHKNVTYLVEKAEQSSLPSNSVDLVTVANALHWFDFDAFYKEVNRVLKNNGVIAAWTMSLPSISPDLDPIIRRYHDHTVDAHWQAENRLVEKEYTTIPFPFQTIPTPSFFCEKEMTLDGLIGYLNTWSATQRFITAQQFNPTDQLRKDLLNVWTDSTSKKKLRWRLILKVGQVKTT
jgi:SAM-dependent methyltransferase